MTDQLGLFPAPPSPLGPEGLAYTPELIGLQEEAALASRLAELPFKAFEFHGFEGKRRTLSYGWRYVFDGSGLQAAEPMPDWLLPIRDAAAAWAALPAEALQHALLTEYAPGAGIGWHRDRSVFDEVVGLSLLAPARLRFRRKAGAKWERAALLAAPRSAYHLTGAARADRERSIAPIEALRSSSTYRTL